MRAIKFRAWDKELKLMFDVIGISFEHELVITKRASVFSDQFFPFEKVELLEFTGLHDSKRTEEYPEGQEIYSGDVYDIGICTKYIRPDHFIEDTYELMKLLEDKAILKVIGNIYEHKDLLGGA